MSPEILTFLGMTATLLIATWTMNRSLRTELREDIIEVRREINGLRTELKADNAALRDEVKEELQAMNTRVASLSERIAGLSGLVQRLREAIVARSVA